MKNEDPVFFVLAAFAGVSIVIFLLSLGILIYAGLAMLICNWVLPMFDIDFPITLYQGCGIGIAIVAIRSMFISTKIPSDK